MRNFTLTTFLNSNNKHFVNFILIMILSIINGYSQNLITNGNFESGGNGVGFIIDGAGYSEISTPFSGTPVAGNYAITTNPNLMFWAFVNSGDHTTGMGKMLVVDGNTTAGSPRLWKAGNTGNGICGLTAGIKYTFSYWMRSNSSTSSTNNRANIEIKVSNASGVTLVSGSTLAPLIADGWIKVVYTFTPTVSGCVTIEFWNNNISYNGNDFAIDDISLIQQPLTVTIISKSDPSNATTNDGKITTEHNGGVPPFTYTLSSGGANASNATGIFTSLPPGSYTVSVTDSNLPPSTATSETVILTAPTMLTPTFNPILPICSGSILSPLPTTSTNGITGTWSPALNNTQTTTYTFTPDAGQDAIPISITIPVNPTPFGVVTPTYSAFCSGTSTNIILSSDQPRTTFTWNVVQTNVMGAFASSGSSINQNLQTTGNIQGYADYTITPFANGCSGLPEVVRITVNPTIPTPTVVSFLEYCQNSMAMPLSATASSGANLNWYWTMTGAIASTQAPIPSTSVIDTNTYYVSQTIGTCESARVGIVVKIVANSIAFITGNQNICEGLSTPFSSTVAGGTWGSSNTAIATVNATTGTVTGVSAGTADIYYTVSGSGFCLDATATRTINVGSAIAPVGELTQTFTQGQTLANLIATGANVTWYAAYDDAILDVNPLPLSTLLENNTYYYATQENFGCASSVEGRSTFSPVLTVLATFSLSNEKFQTNLFHYFPNPVKDILNLSSDLSINDFKIFNIIGQQLLKKEIKTNNYKIDMSIFKKGVYLIELNSESMSHTFKVIKD